MKSRENNLRSKRFQIKEKARQLAQIEMMIAEFDRMTRDLDGQIAYEEQKAGIDDISHFAYPTFAKAARLRRENLATSIEDLKDQRAAARLALEDVQEELVKAQKLKDRNENGLSAQKDAGEARVNQPQAAMS